MAMSLPILMVGLFLLLAATSKKGVFYELQHKGLEGAAVIFTAMALGAAFCGLVAMAGLMGDAGFSRRHAAETIGLFWIGSMTITWQVLAHARQTWPEIHDSTSLFHRFQVISITCCVCYSALSGTLKSEGFQWSCFAMEVVVALFFSSYLFLGLTLRCRVGRSSLLGFAFAIISIYWSSRHLPT